MSHPAQSDFFKPVIAQIQLGNCLFEACVFLSEANRFITVGFADGISRQALLSGLQKILAPAVIQITVDAFLTTKLSDRTFTSQSIQYNADLFFLTRTCEVNYGGSL
jgi:hypothetical protein